ncbi:MAG TPA: hypothetical protein VIL03_02755 [Clostridia bacterium]
MKKTFKNLLTVLIAVALAFSLSACPKKDPGKPKVTVSVADITLQEDEVKDIVVVFDPEDAAEEYEFEIIEGSQYISIRNDKVTGLLEGVATVKVTTSPSNLTTTFKVTVTADPTDPIAKFNTMGQFENTSLKELGWTESTVGQMATTSASDKIKSGEFALEIYGGWDSENEINLTFEYTLSALLRRVPAGSYTLSYFSKYYVKTEVSINNVEYEMTWTHKDNGWDHYVCYFDVASRSDVTISFHFEADENSDNASERYMLIDDISILKYKFVKMAIADFELDLNEEENNTEKTIDENVYTILPALPEGQEITDFELSVPDDTTAVTIEGNKVIAAEVGEAIVTATFKAYGKEFSATFKVTVVDTSSDDVLGGIYKQTVDTINQVGGFESDDWSVYTLGFANYESSDSITQEWADGDWKRSGDMAYKLGSGGLPEGKKIGIYLSGLNFKAGFNYTIKFYTDLNGGITGAAKIFDTLDGVNPYTESGLFSATVNSGSGFVEQTLTFTPASDLNDAVLIFVFENTSSSTLWGCIDDISISYVKAS